MVCAWPISFWGQYAVKAGMRKPPPIGEDIAMKSFSYTITDPLGLHARPAGLLARTAREHPDVDITIAKANGEARATQLMRLMSMGIRQGDEIIVSASGKGEDAAIAAMQQFFRQHL